MRKKEGEKKGREGGRTTDGDSNVEGVVVAGGSEVVIMPIAAAYVHTLSYLVTIFIWVRFKEVKQFS